MNQFIAGSAAFIVALILWGLGRKPHIEGFFSNQQRTAYKEKSEQISLKSVKIATKFEKLGNVIAFLMLKTPNFIDEILLKY